MTGLYLNIYRSKFQKQKLYFTTKVFCPENTNIYDLFCWQNRVKGYNFWANLNFCSYFQFLGIIPGPAWQVNLSILMQNMNF